MSNAATYRPDLQGLRAIAVTLVIAYHLQWPGFGSGFIGVDVFFVLSGYLITRLLLAEADAHGRIHLTAFYARRLRRLLPALLLMVGVTAVVAWYLLPMAAWVEQTRSAPFALTWTSNLYFALRDTGYFDELATRDLFLHTWSLGVEEQFYLLWPLVLLLPLWITGRRHLATAQRHRRISGILLALVAGGLMLSVLLVDQAPVQGFYQMPSRIWQFALGGLLAIWLQTRPVTNASVSSWRWTLAQAVGLGLILASGSGWLAHQPYPGIAALPPSLGACLLIAGGHGHQGHLHRLITLPALRWLGDRSYSLYLWHWPVILLWPPPTDSASTALLWAPLGMILLSLLLADLSYRFVELPFWKGQLSRAPHRLSLLSGTLFILVAGSSFMLIHTGQRERLANDDLHRALRADLPPIYQMPCDSWYHSDNLQPCVFGNAAAGQTVVLIGDSIGAQWFSALPAAFDPAHWRIIVHTKSSCPMVDAPYFYPRIGARYAVCERWRAALVEELRRLRPDVVVMGSSSTYETFGAAEWIDGTRRLLTPLTEAAGQILVIPGTPLLGFDGPACIMEHLTTDGRLPAAACHATGRLAQPATIAGYLAEAVAPIPNAQVLDLNDLVCPADRCAAVGPDGVPVYRDGRHLTDSFVRARAGQIAERVRRVMAHTGASEPTQP